MKKASPPGGGYFPKCRSSVEKDFRGLYEILANGETLVQAAFDTTRLICRYQRNVLALPSQTGVGEGLSNEFLATMSCR